MNTVKRWNGSKSPRLPKKRSAFWNKNRLSCALLASLLGTYADLYLVGKGLYQFPQRLMPDIFSIPVGFNLIGLPVLTMVFLHGLSFMNRWGKAGLILAVSLLMAMWERFAERLGLFAHSDKWMHVYSFFGYLLFLTILAAVDWRLKRKNG